MNKLIQELYIKTLSEECSNPAVVDIEKFAELIVRECVNQIHICSEQIKNDDGYAPDNFWPIMQSIVDAVALDVKEHFGVEE